MQPSIIASLVPTELVLYTLVETGHIAGQPRVATVGPRKFSEDFLHVFTSAHGELLNDVLVSLALVVHACHPCSQRHKELGQPELHSKTLPQKIKMWLVMPPGQAPP